MKDCPIAAVCSHGVLPRSCEVCELKAEIERLMAQAKGAYVQNNLERPYSADEGLTGRSPRRPRGRQAMSVTYFGLTLEQWQDSRMPAHLVAAAPVWDFSPCPKCGSSARLLEFAYRSGDKGGATVEWLKVDCSMCGCRRIFRPRDAGDEIATAIRRRGSRVWVDDTDKGQG
jgi:hypothetical protein